MGFISPKYSIRLYTQASAVRKNSPAANGRIHTIDVRNRLPLSRLREKSVSSLILIPAPPIDYAGIMRQFMKIILLVFVFVGVRDFVVGTVSENLKRLRIQPHLGSHDNIKALAEIGIEIFGVVFRESET